MDGTARALPSNVVRDLNDAIDRQADDGCLPPGEHDTPAVHIEERLVSQMAALRFRHPVRLVTRGR
ncbi:MAG: hypothetical protein ACYC6C_01005 [Coriobacteriia bacterium]